LAEIEARVSNCLEKLELKQRNSCDHLDEKIENIAKTLSHDLRGSLISMMATLKLIRQGYYGEMDERVMNRLRDLFSKAVCLIGVTEECLGETWSIVGDLTMGDNTVNWLPDRNHPFLREFSSELREHPGRMH